MRARFDQVCNVRTLSFCCVPKCGMTSIREALLRSLGVDPFAHGSVHRHPLLARSLPSEARGRTVAVVRDPVERSVSAWRHLLWRNSKDNPSTQLMLDLGFEYRMPFDSYVETLPGVMLKNQHTAPQVVFLPASLDLLAPMERINNLWRILMRDHPWLAPLPVRNSREEEVAAPSKDAAERVRQLYSDDLEAHRSVKKVAEKTIAAIAEAAE